MCIQQSSSRICSDLGASVPCGSDSCDVASNSHCVGIGSLPPEHQECHRQVSYDMEMLHPPGMQESRLVAMHATTNNGYARNGCNGGHHSSLPAYSAKAMHDSIRIRFTVIHHTLYGHTRRSYMCHSCIQMLREYEALCFTLKT